MNGIRIKNTLQFSIETAAVNRYADFMEQRSNINHRISENGGYGQFLIVPFARLFQAVSQSWQRIAELVGGLGCF